MRTALEVTEQPPTSAGAQAVEYTRLLGFLATGGNARGMLRILDPMARRVGRGALRSDSGALRGYPEALRVDLGCAGPVYLAYP